MINKKPDNPYGEAVKFYCKDCNKFVETKKVGRKNVFKCNICKTKNVAFGTEKSLINFYHISDDSSERSEEHSGVSEANESKKEEAVKEEKAEEKAAK